MSVENWDNNEKYTVLSEKEDVHINLDWFDSEKKSLTIYSSLSRFFSEVKIFEQEDYKRINTRKKVSNIFQLILSDVNFDELTSFSIKKWILVLNYNNWGIKYKNLVFSEEKWKKYITELKNTWDITLQNLNKLNELLNNDVLFWWTIVVSYWISSRVWNHFIDKITINLANWTTSIINITKGWINKWTKKQIKSSIFKILEKEWIYYNPKEARFYKIEDIKINIDIKNELKWVTYKKYKEISWLNWEKIISKQEFELNKQKIITELNKTEIKISNIKEIQILLWKYWFGWAIQRVVFLPVFFRTFHSKPNDLASLWKSLSEWWLFELWAKTWAKISKNIPGSPLSKAIVWTTLSLSLWIWSIIAWEEIWEKIELDKNFWKICPEREDYWEKKWWWWKSFLTHVLTAWTINDLVDKLGFDIKIPWTPISFIETNINTDTDIIWYMSSWVWRNMDFWNQRVEKYSRWLIKDIMWLVKKYEKIEYYPHNINEFSENLENDEIEKQIDQKFLELQKSLTSLLNIWTWINENIKKDVLDWILWLIKSWRFNLNKKTIWELVNNNIDKLKLDDYSLFQRKNDMKKQVFKIKTFLWLNNNLSGNLKYQNILDKINSPLKWLSKKEILFSRKMYQKIINHERMINPDINLWVVSIYGRKLEKNQYYVAYWHWRSQYFTLMEKSEDKVIFENLIENDNFLHFLNIVVSYKRKKDFLSNIEKTWYAVKWNLI